MTSQQRPKTQIADETGKTVAANVRRCRELRGLSTYDLARKLKEAGRPIAASAVAKVERAERRVDVGDLMALANALRVSPSALLLPLDDDPAHTVEVTGAGTVPADVAWDWLDGKRPLTYGNDEHAARMEHELYSRPPRRRARLRDTAAVNETLRQAGLDVDDLLHRLGHIEPPDGA